MVLLLWCDVSSVDQEANMCNLSCLQRMLLKAASYGKNFIAHTSSGVHQTFVETCKKLRVLNQLRDSSVRVQVLVVAPSFTVPDVRDVCYVCSPVVL